MTMPTPGPWGITGKNGCLEIVSPDRKVLVMLSASGSREDVEQNAMNARLIAASPDLLQLLREAYELLNDRETTINLVDWLQTTKATLMQIDGVTV